MSVGVSMVLLRDDVPLSGDDFRGRLAALCPDLPASPEMEEKDGVVLLGLGSLRVAVARMPAPFPWSDLEGPCATSVLWPGAAEELKPHKVHWIVTVMGEADPLELAQWLTRATAAALAACPAALGAYWGNAAMVVPKGIFIDFTAQILPQGPPVPIWIDFRVGRDGEASTAGFTCGMAALGHMEFEAQGAPEPPGELRERFEALAGYLLEHGPVIGDGDTIGEDEHERIRVVYSDSAFGHEEQVMRLVYERASPEKPW